MAQCKDHTGKRFGRLVALKRAKNSPAGSARWECLCDCGTTTIVDAQSLVSEHTKSCGCYRIRTFEKTKICSNCKIEKDHSEFKWNKTINQYEAYCKKCKPIKQKERYNKNPERFRAAQKTLSDSIKKETFAFYGGHCICCGEKHIDFLAIDHKNGGGTAHRRSIGIAFSGQRFYRWLKKNGYPNEYQVLCHNCNFSKHLNKGVCAHKQSRIDAILSLPG
jgi:hypothetical protein